MQWMAGRKNSLKNLGICLIIGVFYVGILIYNHVTGQESASLFHINGNLIDMILISLLLICIALIFIMPYLQARKTYKACPDGILKANFYFYERNFQYGWGNHYDTIPYSSVKEVKFLKNGIYFETEKTGYWVKENDFVTGEKENFKEFLLSVVR